MQLQSRTTGRRALARIVWGTVVAALAVATGGTVAPAEAAAGCTYEAALRALTGPGGADMTIGIAGGPACAAVGELKKVQVKAYEADGSLDFVRNLVDVPAPGGVATIALGPIERNRRVEADVLVQPGATGQTYVARGQTTTRLRPDLVVAAVHAPPQTLTTEPIDVVVDVSEINRDTAARATVELSWGPSLLGAKTVDVAAGETVASPSPPSR